METRGLAAACSTECAMDTLDMGCRLQVNGFRQRRQACPNYIVATIRWNSRHWFSLEYRSRTN